MHKLELPSKPLTPVPFNAVQLLDGFWQARVRTNRDVTLLHALDRCENEGRVDNFRRAALVLQGQVLENKSPPGYPFDDTDVYKIIEAAAYSLAIEPNPGRWSSRLHANTGRIRSLE